MFLPVCVDTMPDLPPDLPSDALSLLPVSEGLMKLEPRGGETPMVVEVDCWS